MRFTKGKKTIFVGIIVTALIAGAWSNVGKFGSVNAGEQVPAVQESEAPVPTPTAIPGYENVAGIPVTSGAISVNEALIIDEMDFTEHTTSSITISWDCGSLTDGTYYIYRYNDKTMEYDYIASTKEKTYVCKGLKAAKKYYFTVCAFDEVNRLQGAFATPLETYTKPKKVQNLTFIESKKDKIELKWDAASDADGYIIYHAKGSGKFVEAGRTTETTFLDEGLLSGKNYRYKVWSYIFNEDNISAASSVGKMTTLPATPVITVKGGNKKTRISWNAITGAAGYHLYWYDDKEYQLLATLEGKKSTEYIHTGLKNGANSRYKVAAYRLLNEVEYKSAASTMKKATTAKQSTVTSPTLFKTKQKLQKSSAYLLNKDFKSALNYSKSYVIPGVSGTDVDGFYSKNMCPQGITFAGSYLLISAYDKKKEENSVIYVMNESDRKLVMTVILPNKTHAGGIAYDGTNIWVTQTNTVRSISFSGIKSAISKGQKEYLASFNTVCTLTHKAGSLTYYKSKLWVASYDELKSGYLGAYSINKKSGSPELKLVTLTRIPTRVQGLEFTSGGKLILSRSCQTNATQRGFLHVLDIYQPDLAKLSSGTIKLGAVKKTVDMPTMNEEIAICGSYLYVNFESVAFSTAVERMDRVCALKTSTITSLKKETTLKKSSLKSLEKTESIGDLVDMVE